MNRGELSRQKLQHEIAGKKTKSWYGYSQNCERPAEMTLV